MVADLATIKLAERFLCNVLLKGGHGEGYDLIDRLYDQGMGGHDKAAVKHFTHTKLNTKNTHGTGCTLASALSSYIAKGQVLELATENAIKYLHQAIQGADHLSVGHGHGPVKHFTIANSH